MKLKQPFAVVVFCLVHAVGEVGLELVSAQASNPLTGQDQQLYRFSGPAIEDEFGRAAVGLGDLNGDGRGDFAVAAPRPYADGRGHVDVFSGANGVMLYQLSADQPVDGTSDRFGLELFALEDLDGDGFQELVVGAPWDDDGGSQAGAVSVYSGRTGTFLARLNGPGAGAQFGTAFASPGDVNGDGVVDLVASGTPTGEVRMISGEWVLANAMGGVAVTAPFLWLAKVEAEGGAALATVGDLTGDGVRDLAVGQPWVGGDPQDPSGTVTFLDGASGAALGSIAGGPGENFGLALADAGDLNGDGRAELAVGAPGANGAGGVRVYDGASLLAASPLELWRSDAELGVERFGFELAAGDWNGDGVLDVAASALVGPAGGFARAFNGSDGQLLFELAGEDPQSRLGWSLSAGGDVNGDLHGDLLLGAPRAGGTSEGALRVYSGARLSLTAEAHQLSVDTGGSIQLSLFGGSAVANQLHLILGSASGTGPGLPSPVGTLPLNFDSYTLYTYSPRPELQGFIGFFDAVGNSAAALTLPGPLAPGLIGLELHYAWVSLDLTNPIDPISAVSVAVPIRFISDDCSVVDGAPDCNGNGRSDACDIADGTSADCNGNGVPDECDLAAGTSLDLDFDSLPDECQRDRFVNIAAPAGGDGAGWATAWNDLGEALANSKPYDRLWVAQGTYRLTAFNGTFSVGPRRSLLGGFGGFETDLSQRDPELYPTILSGDVNGNDAPGFQGSAENARTVMTVPSTADASTVIDGVVVRGGFADEAFACTFYQIFNNACTAGGVYCLGSATFRNCIFEDNFGGFQGGGVYTTTTPTFEYCTFRRNEALSGGAVFTEIGGAPFFTGCTFLNNSAVEGGAIASVGASSHGPRGSNCLFNGNSALAAGGALWALDVSPSFTLSTFHGNTTSGQGAVTFGAGATDIALFNSILWGNSAGGAFGEAAQIAGVPPRFLRCLVEGWTGTLEGTATDGAPPVFVDPLGPDFLAGTGDENLRLGSTSAAVDSGLDAALGLDELDLDRDGNRLEPLPFDLDRAPREQDDPAVPDAQSGVAPVVDRGAYERAAP